ncbi:MAG TPA: signal peptidase II [Longimicrobium sp.]|jgi:lipoprotein signal peptidase
MRGWIPTALIALGVALLDWAVKYRVAHSVPLDVLREVIPGRLALWHVRNSAMVLGLWDNFPVGTRKLIAAVASVLGAFVLMEIVVRSHRLPRGQRAWAWLFVGLVLGGMLGNLGERVVHWGVTDYLSIHWAGYWLPPGNVADIALILSMPLAIPVIVFELMGRARRGKVPLVRPTVASEMGD